MSATGVTEICLRELRAKRHNDCIGIDKARPPLLNAYRHDFNNCAYPGGDVDLSLQIALESVDRNFEIIYDRSITPHDGSPGHCLYRKIRNGGVESEDYFVLEFPLQWECDKQWPHGRPRAPGQWVVDEAKKRIAAKNAFGGDTLEKATENQVESMIDANDENKAQIAKVHEELKSELDKDFIKYAVRGAVTTSGASPLPHSRPKRGRPKGSKNK